MKIGYIGLGKMGLGMVKLLLENGHEVVATDPNEAARKEAEAAGAETVENLSDFDTKLSGEKFIWIMVPHNIVDDVLSDLSSILNPGDVIMDGGNSNYQETVRRGQELKSKGLVFMDVGVSGGPSGARNGACMMIGGAREKFDKYEQLFKDLCIEGGYAYMGETGAGHYVKMVHNGIEYGMMQAIGEGFEILKESRFDLDLQEVSRIYNTGSVIESRLVGWLENAYKEEGVELTAISGEVSHSGEGQWTVAEAKNCVGKDGSSKNIPAPVIEASFQFRLGSTGNPSYTGQVVSALRNQFGGHSVKKED
ncbi:MAG: decarboxylating 6-phosphogluconate dehydrogenase [Emcibacteraceae bacterium]|nr:decarboxylating 6-phosphogluconate dehydrogenase [Emcibacteraceae bacterium]MDG1727103.1 decarboxylating 6-phosphogluconate dehydrogenase [Emcibacteraceae bacterium]